MDESSNIVEIALNEMSLLSSPTKLVTVLLITLLVSSENGSLHFRNFCGGALFAVAFFWSRSNLIDLISPSSLNDDYSKQPAHLRESIYLA